jgi:hypothetical protein
MYLNAVTATVCNAAIPDDQALWFRPKRPRKGRKRGRTLAVMTRTTEAAHEIALKIIAG